MNGTVLRTNRLLMGGSALFCLISAQPSVSSDDPNSPSQRIAHAPDAVPIQPPIRQPQSDFPLAGPWPDVAISRSSYGETLAVFALLLPLIADGAAFVIGFDDWATIFSWGAVFITAVLLGIDAATLAKPVVGDVR